MLRFKRPPPSISRPGPPQPGDASCTDSDDSGDELEEKARLFCAPRTLPAAHGAHDPDSRVRRLQCGDV